MYYRRKILLSLGQLCNGKIEKLKFLKLLFLYCQRKSIAEYDFIPYKFGCYSYTVNADLNTLAKKEHIDYGESHLIVSDKTNYLSQIKPNDKKLLIETVRTYGSMSTDSIIRHTYINFPFYATKSTIAKKILSDEQYSIVIDSLPKTQEVCLFTIGYEGISLEKYLNKLISNNISLLLDVRKNPFSHKFGFSKGSLKKYCESINVSYTHLPELGIHSNKRQSLETQGDYDLLFEEYRKTTLKSSIETQTKIIESVYKYKRVALTCFESNVHQCHRFHLANSLKKIDKQLFLNHV